MNRIKWWQRLRHWLNQTEWNPAPTVVPIVREPRVVTYELPPEAPAPASPVLEAGWEKPVSGGEVMGGTLSNQPSLPSDIEIQRAKAEELFRRWHG